MCASIAAMKSIAITAWITVQNCSAVTLAGRYGNSRNQPDTDISAPPMITIQKMPFCPALKRLAGGCLPFEQHAAALLEPFQVELAWNVILDPDQEHDREPEHERERQIVVREFCVSRHGREGFGTKQRQNAGRRPKLMLRPESASTMKQLAVSQWVNRSKLAKRRILLPEKP